MMGTGWNWTGWICQIDDHLELVGKPTDDQSLNVISILTLKALKYFCINHRDQSFFSIWHHHKCLGQLTPIHLNTCVMCLQVYGQYNFLNSFIAGTVSRRQILTSKVGPRAERVDRMS